jgi:hypothetical protein
MIDGVMKLLDDMKDIEYVEFTRLMSPLEVVVTRRGSCHDQVMLEMEELQELCLRPKAKFIMAVGETGQGLDTHSFVYFRSDKTWIWFENAWKNYRGVHQYPDEDSLISDVMTKFAGYVGDSANKFYITAFNPDEHTIGEDLPDLVNICMEHAVEINL